MSHFFDMAYNLLFVTSHVGIWATIVVWIVGIFVDIMTCTAENFKFHPSCSLFGGYTTHDDRELTTKDVWSALIWPFKMLLGAICAFIFIFCDILAVFLLLFGFKFKKTNIYQKLTNL